MKLSKERKTDRVLILKVKDGEKAKDSIGLTDPRLFTGENNLHVKMDPKNSLWTLCYDHGMVPVPFRQQFTTFNTALKFVTEYYKKRNIEIADVVD